MAERLVAAQGFTPSRLRASLCQLRESGVAPVATRSLLAGAATISASRLYEGRAAITPHLVLVHMANP